MNPLNLSRALAAAALSLVLLHANAAPATKPLAERPTHVAAFDTFCTKPWACAPLTPKMQENLLLFKTGAMKPLGCRTEPYEIKKVVEFKGEQFLQVTLAKLPPGGPELSLPKFTHIPAIGKDGKPVGVRPVGPCQVSPPLHAVQGQIAQEKREGRSASRQ